VGCILRTLSEGSEALYQYWLERCQRYCKSTSLTLSQGEAFLESLKVSGLNANTRAVAARALRRAGLDVQAPTIEMVEPSYLELDQVKALIAAAPSLLESTILTVLFSSACRISEVLNLMVEDLELDKGVATVTRKGGRRERISLGQQGTDALVEWLERRRSKDKRVFMDYTYHDLYARLHKLGRRMGIPHFHPHLLRHSRVMHLRMAGRDWSDISEICGHTSLQTTIKIYGRRKAEERSALLVDF
jgi:integrase